MFIKTKLVSYRMQRLQRLNTTDLGYEMTLERSFLWFKPWLKTVLVEVPSHNLDVSLNHWDELISSGKRIK